MSDEALILQIPELAEALPEALSEALPALPALFAALGEGQGAPTGPPAGLAGPPAGVPPALWASMCKQRLEDMHQSKCLTASEREEHLKKRTYEVPGPKRRTLKLLEDPSGKFGGSCGSGTVLWPAAAALIEFLDGKVEKSCLNVRSLELGAGCGAVGLFLNLFKGCEVWLTEVPELLPLLARNVSENSPDGLDLQVAPLRWGDVEAVEQLATLGLFDLIVGSDVTYRPECLSDLLSTALRLLSPQGRCFLSLQDRPGEASQLEAQLSKCPLRSTRHSTRAKIHGSDEVPEVPEVPVLIYELCHAAASADPQPLQPTLETTVEEEFFRLTGIRPEPVVVPKLEKPPAPEIVKPRSFRERVKDLIDQGMADAIDETTSKVAAGYPLSMLERPQQLEAAMAEAAAEDWFGPSPNEGRSVSQSEEQSPDPCPTQLSEPKASKTGVVLKCLDGLDWELLDQEDSLSVTVTFAEELWFNLCGVSGTKTFKEAVSFELAEEELRVLHAGSVVLHLRLPSAVDAQKASASVSSRKMRVAIKATKR